MTSLEAAIAIMKIDIASGRATKRSLGVMYAMIMAGNRCTEPDFWGPINRAILVGLKGQLNQTQRIRYLDGVKKVAWDIFKAAGRSAECAQASNERGEATTPDLPST